MEVQVNGAKVLLTPIPGAFSNYRCDVVNGRVYSLELGRFLISNPGKRFGYCKVRMKKDDGSWKVLGVHEVVMSSAMGVEVSWWRNQTPKLEVHHLDDAKVKINNGIANLELTTRKKNMQQSSHKFGDTKRLGSDLALMIKLEFKKFDGKKSEFINGWLKLLNHEFTYSSIENVVIGKTYKNLEMN
ncbi:hypothetical protein IHV10_06415 [Fictibacillus sp. 5RED26]|uniref:hypothetical protein n=1 Tax=Fictibacillus sp. 5RED26 TaxID=2745876 RepID=UPI0018CF49D5|nr:hypothetical protein [Fictibacillus sp. 5RED26]MBH0155996.1 hypothetical protein [Fictibacillus sp. 5RED26]